MEVLKGIGNAGWARTTVDFLSSQYLRLVWTSSRFGIEPEDFYEWVEPQLPVNVAMWRFDRKGGVGAFNAMMAALQDVWTMALTADIPKASRKAGTGIVKLAQRSGRAIVPIAVPTSRRIEFDNWDRSALNLPFSCGAMVFGDPIRVPADASEAALEAACQTVETRLTVTTERAYEIVDRRRWHRA